MKKMTVKTYRCETNSVELGDFDRKMIVYKGWYDIGNSKQWPMILKRNDHLKGNKRVYQFRNYFDGQESGKSHYIVIGWWGAQRLLWLQQMHPIQKSIKNINLVNHGWKISLVSISGTFVLEHIKNIFHFIYNLFI